MATRTLPARGNCYKANCPTRAIFGHVTGRWGGLVLGALRERTLRYSELRRHIEGVSEKMLAQTLRELEADGLIARHQHPVMPPHVDYALTKPGREIADRLAALIGWLEANVADLVAAQTAHRTKAPTAPPPLL
jgi:DNA-binding HxlR family transcriptional regulator